MGGSGGRRGEGEEEEVPDLALDLLEEAGLLALFEKEEEEEENEEEEEDLALLEEACLLFVILVNRYCLSLHFISSSRYIALVSPSFHSTLYHARGSSESSSAGSTSTTFPL